MSGTRESTTRAATQRAALGDKPRLRLDTDLTGLPSDMEAVWVRETNGGAIDEGNIEDALDRGLQFATREMLPLARKSATIPGRPAPTDSLIRRMDAVLMVGPKRVFQAEREAVAARGQAQIASVQRLGNDAGAELDGENFIENSKVHDEVQRAGRPPSKSKFPE